ncbi:winged helix-turn-helix transcriptional regulator [Pedobacter sp. GSP4]|uniref:winged helix-turn-helix transcriptional regulator n=1 Tax=Pedobacter sp. GSP4 TaxID=3453716 RepID=UPI003EE98D29
MTTKANDEHAEPCKAQALLKLLSGKFRPAIFRLSLDAPLRFSSLLRDIPGANKQSLSTALRELEEVGLLERKVVRLKPLHVEYYLTTKGRSLVPFFEQLELLGEN